MFRHWFHIFNKREISLFSGSQEGEADSERRYALPSFIANMHSDAVRGHDTFLPWSQVSVALQTQTPLWDALSSTSLPHHRYFCGPFSPAGWVAGSLVSASQPVTLAHLDNQALQCNSTCPASP